jgi:hypothetical protein
MHGECGRIYAVLGLNLSVLSPIGAGHENKL